MNTSKVGEYQKHCFFWCVEAPRSTWPGTRINIVEHVQASPIIQKIIPMSYGLSTTFQSYLPLSSRSVLHTSHISFTLFFSPNYRLYSDFSNFSPKIQSFNKPSSRFCCWANILETLICFFRESFTVFDFYLFFFHFHWIDWGGTG